MKPLKSSKLVFFIVVLIGLGSGWLAYWSYQRYRTPEVPIYSYKVVRVLPHDRKAYTQGLLLTGGHLYESTGIKGQSTIRQVDLNTGAVLRLKKLPDRFFGEAIALDGGKLVQLTWKSHVGFVYDLRDFSLLREFVYPTQGWGLTYDGSNLIMSDGTDTLYFLDRETYRTVRKVYVRADGKPVAELNELEYIDGKIYANVYRTDRIAIIDPISGHVDAWIDLKGLLGLQDYRERVGVLNGIALDEKTGHLLVTGKLWPKLFEIEVVK